MYCYILLVVMTWLWIIVWWTSMVTWQEWWQESLAIRGEERSVNPVHLSSRIALSGKNIRKECSSMPWFFLCSFLKDISKFIRKIHQSFHQNIFKMCRNSSQNVFNNFSKCLPTQFSKNFKYFIIEPFYSRRAKWTKTHFTKHTFEVV